jgi:hypothetical protein
MDQLVSPLLWADDFIFLELDPITLQKQLDLDYLTNFCHQWGIEINTDETKLQIQFKISIILSAALQYR